MPRKTAPAERGTPRRKSGFNEAAARCRGKPMEQQAQQMEELALQ